MIGSGALAAQHHIIKETSESLGELLQGVLQQAGYQRVHLVVAAPNKEAIEGKLPAVSIYLYNVTLDEEGLGMHGLRQHVEQLRDEDGKVREVARDAPLWVRLDYLLSTWAQTPEQEHLLLGATIKGILEHPTLSGPLLRGESMASVTEVPLLLSQKLDEGVLSRFWSSLSQPLKPAVQCWTTVPIYPGTAHEVSTRVSGTEMRFLDLNQQERPTR